MTGPIVLEVVGVPASQGSKSAVMIGGRARLIEGKRGSARAALADWRGAVADQARMWVLQNRALPLAEAVRVSLVFRFAPVGSDPYRTLHTTKPDIDKITRATLDALVAGGLLSDDSRVCSLVAEKRYASIGESVGVTVEVEALGWYEVQRRSVLKAAAAAARRQHRMSA